MNVQVKVLPGSLLSDNRRQYYAGDELEMELAEANRRVTQDKVEMVGPSVMVQLPESFSDFSAAEKIEAVKAAITTTALAELREGEARKTVLAAIETREQELLEIGK